MECHCCKIGKYSEISEKVYKCSNCGNVFRDYRHIDLQDYYDNYYRKNFKLYPEVERRKYCTNVINFFAYSQWLPSNYTVLEVGAGDGFLSTMIKPINNNICTAEMDSGLRKKLEEQGFEAYGNFLNIEGKFDAVVAIDILEHILNPREFYQKCLDLGVKTVVLQIPFNRGTQYNPNFDGHFHYFGLQSLEELFEDYNLVKHRVTNRGETARGQGLLTIFQHPEHNIT